MEQQKEIRKLFEKYIFYWNNHDITNWGELFTEDTIFITWSGVVYKNNSENVKLHHKAHQILSEQNQNMTYNLEVFNISLLDNDIAVVHATWEWTDFKTEKSGTETRTGILTMVLLKSNGRWLIRSTHNTRIQKKQG